MTDISLRYLLFGEDRSASKTARGVAGEAESSASKVGGAFSRMGQVVGGEVGEILNKVGEGLNQIGEHSKKMSAALIVGGSAVTGLGAALQMLGSKDKQAQDQLKQAITDTGASYSDYRDEIEKTIKKQENYDHSAVDTQKALQVLTQATGDPKRAIEDMGVVANLAAAKHISLSDAALKVAKVYGGSSKVLKEFGINLTSAKAAATALSSAETKHQQAVDQLSHAQQHLSDLETIDAGKKKLSAAQTIALRNAHDAVKQAQDRVAHSTLVLQSAQENNTKATHAAQDAIDQLGQKTAGQAKAAVDNFGARVDILKTKLEDWAANVGNKVGPAMTALGPVLMATGAIMQIVATRNAAAAVAQDAEAAATLRQKVAQEAAAVASKGWAAAQWLLNAALDANPIAIVVIAVAALVAGMVIAYQHSQTFRDIVAGAFNAIGDAVSFLKDHWQIFFTIFMAALGPMGLAIALIVTHFSEFKAVALDAFRFVANAFLDVVGALVDGAAHAFGWVPGLGGKLKSAAKEFDSFRDSVNRALGGISDKTVHVNVDLQTSHAANVALHQVAPGTIGSARAAGGPVGPGSMYLVGERGPEVVTFGAAGYVTPNSRTRQILGGGDAGGISVTLQAGALTRDGAREIDRVLRQLARETGGALGLA